MHLYVSKKNKKQIKSEDMIQNKTLICPEKTPVARENMLAQVLICSKYKSFLNSDTWGNNVSPELNISSQILYGNIPKTNYLDIQKYNLLQHSYFMKNGCDCFEPSCICDQ